MNPAILQAHVDDEPIDLDQELALDDPLVARRLLIELHISEQKAESLRATMAAVQGEYQSRIDGIQDRVAAIRQSLHIYAERNGGTTFPDVGGFHLMQRKPRLVVGDGPVFSEWAREHGFTQEVVDLKAARDEANHLFDQGEIVPGTVLDEPEPSLVIRGAK